MIAIAIFVVSNLAHVAFWYFMVLYAPAFLAAVSQVTQTGRPTGGTIELLQLSTQLTLVVLRWGIIPIYIGAVGDLTLFYLGFGTIVALLLVVWARRRW